MPLNKHLFSISDFDILTDATSKSDKLSYKETGVLTIDPSAFFEHHDINAEDIDSRAKVEFIDGKMVISFGLSSKEEPRDEDAQEPILSTVEDIQVSKYDADFVFEYGFTDVFQLKFKEDSAAFSHSTLQRLAEDLCEPEASTFQALDAHQHLRLERQEELVELSLITKEFKEHRDDEVIYKKYTTSILLAEEECEKLSSLICRTIL